MKKLLLTAGLVGATLIASAEAYERPTFAEGWSVGVTASAVTPLKGHSFFTNMRPAVGLVLDKKITPAFSIGAEGIFSINTSRWNTHFGRLVHSGTAFDHSYVGAYGALDFMRLSSSLKNPFFSMGIQAGAGWGREYFTSSYYGNTYNPAHNFFATKAGLFFNFNVCEHFTISIEPSVIYDMSDARQPHNTATYNANYAAFNIQAGFKYHFGKPFMSVRMYDEAEIAALNAQVNALRADAEAAVAGAAAAAANVVALDAALQECLARPQVVEVVKEVEDNSRQDYILDVFFNIGSSVITAAQMPNVERIADFLKSHPDYKVVVKGYASKDGNLDYNLKLAAARAESVRNTLIKKYGIKANRIQAEGCGIGEMFEVESWNRVSVCTLEEK